MDIRSGILKLPNGDLLMGYENFYDLENQKSLSYHFKTIKDFRRDRGKKYPLYICLLFLTWGFVEGFSSVREMVRKAQSLEEAEPYFFETILGSAHGIPSHDTLSRVLRELDQDEIFRAFINWINALTEEEGFHIAIDGKAVKSSKKASAGKILPPYILNVYDVTNHCFIAQIEIKTKKNEISTIPIVLEKLNEYCPGIFEGTTITTDGIGTQQTILEKTETVGASIVSPVKDNQKFLKEEISNMLNEATKDYKNHPDNSKLTTAIQRNFREHGRNEIRVCKAYVLEDDETFNDMGAFNNILTIGEITRFREIIMTNGKRKFSVEKTIYQSTAPMDAQELLEYSRDHWGCEVSHWHLDNKLNEDASTANCGNAMANLSLLRKAAMNLLQKTKEALAQSSLTAIQDSFQFQPKKILELLITGNIS